MEPIDKRIKKRASQAFKFLPFNNIFYSDVQLNGLSAENVFSNRQRYCLRKCKWFDNADSLENSFRWLIKVGILRREVDGQGLTSKIRLTPLGRQLLEINPNIPSEKLNIFNRTINCLLIKFSL